MPVRLPFDRLRGAGSKVLNLLSVVRFSLCDRKTNNKKMMKYRCD
jgi:hypothetical protein